MTTVNRTIETENDKEMAVKLIEARTIPFTLTLTDGKHRTTAQNKLQRLWMNEISQQRGDMTPEEARGYCKLTIGVPLLRAENEAFRIRYDEVVKPMPYEQKLAIMMEPLDLPVTRLMTTKQKTEYLDGIARHFAEQGVVLTMPEDMQSSNNSPSAEDAPVPADDDGAAAPSVAPAESPVSPAAGASSSKTDAFGKFNYKGDDLRWLREFAEKAIKEARRTSKGDPAAIQFVATMYPQYAALLVSADAIKALKSINNAMDLVLNGDRNVDRIEAWFETEFFSDELMGGVGNG